MTELTAMLRIEPISTLHHRNDFKCRKKLLTQYLHRYARQNDKNNIARTFVAVDENNRGWGYYSLSTSSIEFAELPDAFAKRLPRYPVPAALIAKLAVDEKISGQGLGARLLIEALQHILAAAGAVAIKVILVDAIDDEARQFYLKFGFIELPGQSQKLFLPIETIRQLFAD